jgi:hypothetical protein
MELRTALPDENAMRKATPKQRTLPLTTTLAMA